jgi:hypothetical protein
MPDEEKKSKTKLKKDFVNPKQPNIKTYPGLVSVMSVPFRPDKDQMNAMMDQKKIKVLCSSIDLNLHSVTLLLYV